MSLLATGELIFDARLAGQTGGFRPELGDCRGFAPLRRPFTNL
jgi:hypothetical protein